MLYNTLVLSGYDVREKTEKDVPYAESKAAESFMHLYHDSIYLYQRTWQSATNVEKNEYKVFIAEDENLDIDSL